MFLFQEQPDPIFLAIFREALEYVREVQLVQFREGHQPTRSRVRRLRSGDGKGVRRSRNGDGCGRTN